MARHLFPLLPKSLKTSHVSLMVSSSIFLIKILSSLWWDMICATNIEVDLFVLYMVNLLLWSLVDFCGRFNYVGILLNFWWFFIILFVYCSFSIGFLDFIENLIYVDCFLRFVFDIYRFACFKTAINRPYDVHHQNCHLNKLLSQTKGDGPLYVTCSLLWVECLSL